MTLLEQVDLSQLLAENAELRRRLAGAEAALARSPGPLRPEDGTGPWSSLPGSDDSATVVLDGDGKILDWSPPAETMLGWAAGEVVGRPMEALIIQERPLGARPRADRSDPVAAGPGWYWRSDGTRIRLVGETRRLLDPAGNARGWLVLLRDGSFDAGRSRETTVDADQLEYSLGAFDLVCTWDWDMQKDRVYAGARFAALFGLDPDRAGQGISIADYLDRIHPDDRDRAAEEIEATVNTDKPYAMEFRTIDAAGAVRHVKARGRCIRDAAGRPQHFTGALVDVTADRWWQIRQSALLQISDDALSAGPTFDHRARIAEILGRTLGLCRAGYVRLDSQGSIATVIGQWTDVGVSPLPDLLERRRFGSQLAKALAEGLVAISDVATHELTRDGLAAWSQIDVRSFAIFPGVDQDRQGPTLFLHHSRPHDWTEDELAFVGEALRRSSHFAESRRLSEARLNAETRLRLAQEAANIGTFDYNLVTGELLWDKRCRAAFGVFDDYPVTLEETFLPALHPDERDVVLQGVVEAITPPGNVSFDMVHRTIGRDGVIRWVHASAQTVVEHGVSVRFVGAVRDMTREREDEERRQFLSRELQHRVKNTLSMVNALANQTMGRAPTAQVGLANFTERLIALGRANDLLLQNSWRDADIADIVSQSLRTLQPEEDGRVSWQGPRVLLTAKQSLALGLALHELSTNAVKYGALCNDTGRISVSWSVLERPDDALLRLEWRESDGPKVSVPKALGFGSRLIEKTLALEFGGTVGLSYHETGVVCVVEAPISPQAAPAG